MNEKMSAMDRAEPYKIKAVEFIQKSTRGYRERRIRECGYNVFFLTSDDIFIDLLTDSGVGAMSDNQWAGIMMGDETYAGSRNFTHLRDTIKDILGFPYVVPTHQGRGAENVLDKALIREGDIIPGNKHFDTTKAHIEDKKGIAVDCTIEEAYDPSLDHPFKGNLDIEKLEAAISEHGAGKVPYILVTVTCNSGGGQPVSIENIRRVSAVGKEFGVPLFFDAARYAENAWFIKQREEEFRDSTIREIVAEMMSYADGMTMSAKKDAIVNIGGFIAMRDEELYQKCALLGVLFEGFPTYGGLAGRDLEAISRGLYEGVRLDYLTARIGQTHYLGNRLREIGIPIMNPIGGHAVYVDCKAFLPHIPQEEFPGWTLSAELYVEVGVRGVEIGTVLDGRDPVTGRNRLPKLDLLRLTIPRRVYTNNHMDVVVEGFAAIKERKDGIVGMKFDHEPPVLRHFLCTMKRVNEE